MFGVSNWFNNPAVKLLETQVQAALREQQTIANRLIQNGLNQYQGATRQFQVLANLQSIQVNQMAQKGTTEVSDIFSF